MARIRPVLKCRDFEVSDRTLMCHLAGLHTNIVVPPSELRVACGCFWEGRFADKSICLVVQVVLDVVPKQEREQSRLQVVVMAQGGCALSSEQRSVEVTMTTVSVTSAVLMMDGRRGTHVRRDDVSSPASSCSLTQ